MRVKIKEQLDKIDRNLNWLSMKTEITYSTLHKLANNKTESVRFDILEKICVILNCGIEDILEITTKE